MPVVIMKSITAHSCSYALLFLLGSGFLQGAVVIFDAEDGDPLDGGAGGGGIGATQFDTTTGSTVSVTTTDIVGYDATSSSFISALGLGPNHVTNIQASSASFGVNSASTPPGAASDARDFEVGEQWVFVFSEDVRLVTIDFAGQTGAGGDVFQISSPAFAGTPFSLPDGQTGDVHDLGNTLVLAGTEVTFQATAGNGMRISQFTVDTVPEPSVSLLFGLSSLGLLARRRR